MAYVLVFEGKLPDGSIPENQATNLLTARLSEVLPIPILHTWDEVLWKTSVKDEMVGNLVTAGDCLVGYWVKISSIEWLKLVNELWKEKKIDIA